MKQDHIIAKLRKLTAAITAKTNTKERGHIIIEALKAMRTELENVTGSELVCMFKQANPQNNISYNALKRYAKAAKVGLHLKQGFPEKAGLIKTEKRRGLKAITLVGIEKGLSKPALITYVFNNLTPSNSSRLNIFLRELAKENIANKKLHRRIRALVNARIPFDASCTLPCSNGGSNGRRPTHASR